MTGNLLFAAALLAALAYLPVSAAGPSVRKTAVKTVPLTLFGLLALLAGAPLLLVAGLALSALGDLALSRAGERAFLAGLVGFALAHVAYVALFLLVPGHAGLSGLAAHPVAAAALVALALSTELWLSPHTGDLRWPVRLYVLLITGMGLAALGLPAARSLAVLGAAFFVLSDLILSVQLFRLGEEHALSRPAGWALWALYVAGQALILLAFVPLSLPSAG